MTWKVEYQGENGEWWTFTPGLEEWVRSRLSPPFVRFTLRSLLRKVDLWKKCSAAMDLFFVYRLTDTETGQTIIL